MPLRFYMRCCVGCCLLFAVSITTTAQEPSVAVIDSVNIIDVETGSLQPNQRIVIADNKIVALGSIDSLAIPDQASVIDAQNQYLIPGLFDAHVHFISDSSSFAPLLVAHGVTSVRDLGAPTDLIMAMKRSADSNEAPFPDITATGAIIDGDPPTWPFSEVAENEEQAVAAVRKLAAAGVDQIKVYSKLKREAYLAVIAEAKRLDLPVVGHVPYSVTLEEAVRAGQKTIEHLDGFGPLLNQLTDAPADNSSGRVQAFAGWSRWRQLDRANLNALSALHREQKTIHVPTLVVMEGIGRITDESNDPTKDPRIKYVSTSMLNFWKNQRYDTFSPTARAALPSMTEAVGELYRQGVTLAIGTDLANPFVFAGSAVHDEMEKFAEAGIPAPEILKMATLIPAQLCRVDQERGSIAVGKVASLVLLKANPLENIGAVRAIESVWLRGKHFDRPALDELLRSVENRDQNVDPNSDPTIPPAMPGTIVRQGRYRFKFLQFDAGSESFRVSKTADGYHTWSHSQPQGGGQLPAIVRTHFTLDGGLQAAEYQILDDRKLTARYRIKDDQLEGIATVAGQAEESATAPLTAPYRISAPIYATDFMYYPQLGLDVGESTTIQSTGFGFPDWKPATVQVEIRREENQTIELDGTTWETSVYFSQYKSGTGEIQITTWLDNEGHTVKSTLKLPFGSLTVTRELETTE